ncbi:GNAT family N-acetyltransferase [Paenibacillus aceris]|uniref:GNAT family acetyltransferase n=1 Tax=Paenibacillus aceris TaxID=869555 RepID=A0ABS4HVU7_9BACL|nr:GNAT family N-acetyltransferase [Paenibacillus aceris]MBP1962767.1 putative GNAT family acetyltransferase [Paenibacillus aceris]NHW33870.1 GNAT family N-acetyltransferase [Paenibacillus aceris]
MIQLIKYDDLSAFKKDVTSFLEQNEAANNLLLGVLQSLSEKEDNPFYMAAVRKDNAIGLVFLQTLPKQIILSKPVSFSTQDIHDIGVKLTDTIQTIHGLLGEKKVTTELAQYISNEKGIPFHVLKEQKIYQLEKIKKPPQTNGELRQITENDHHLIKEWVYQFCKETNQPIRIEDAEIKTTFMINKGNFVAWEVNGKLVSMAYATRPTQTNVTVTYVYTPISERKKGYASDCVSAFTQHLLDRGFKTTSLYADLSNPTSNKVYIQIGYEAILDSIDIQFQ